MTIESQRRSVPCSIAHRTSDVVPKHVAVSADHVQSAELSRIRMRLVARVDDRTVEGGLQSDFVFDEVGSLGHLEAGNLALLPASDAAGPANDGTRHHEGRETSDDRIEVRDTRHLVVLVGAVGGTLTVRVVLDKDDGFFALFLQACHDALGDNLAGAVPQERIARTDRFGCGVLGVRVVDVQACAIREDGGRRRWKGQFFGGRPSDAFRTARRCEVVRIVSKKRRVGSRT